MEVNQSSYRSLNLLFGPFWTGSAGVGVRLDFMVGVRQCQLRQIVHAYARRHFIRVADGLRQLGDHAYARSASTSVGAAEPFSGTRKRALENCHTTNWQRITNKTVLRINYSAVPSYLFMAGRMRDAMI